jgi:hypothetical protein
VHKIICNNKFFLVGKVKELLEALEIVSKDFSTLKDLIDSELNQ